MTPAEKKPRVRKPLTPEQRARKLAKARAWRRRNRAHVREYDRRRADIVNARRRVKYATDAEHARRERARKSRWKSARPDYNAKFYAKHREEFTGLGRWGKKGRMVRDGMKTWAQTLAANRARAQQVAP